MKCVSLVSSGIDSPVATFLLSKTIDEIVLVHADNRPFTDDRELEKYVSLAKLLKTQGVPVEKAYIVSHGPALSSFQQRCERRFICVFCKRMMLRYAEKIAKNEGAEAIIMGDSLGQVASQTLHNIQVIEQAVTIPVLRPLIGFDKDDVVQIAKNIGTYDLSIAPSVGCTAVPSKPATKATVEQMISEEKNIDIDSFVQCAVKNAKRVNF